MLQQTTKRNIYFIIDGLGNPNNNPFTIRIKFLIQKASNKTWTRLERKVTHLFQPNTHAQYLQNKTPKTNKRQPFIVLSIIIIITSFALLSVE